MRKGLVALVFLVACSPLYGAKPDKLAKPPTKKKPPEEKAAVVEIKYIDDCPTNFRDDPKGVKSDHVLGEKLAGDGDAALDVAKKAKEPSAMANSYKEAIDKYGNALKKDPFNPDITLKLAIAYDLVYRKGCALAMLHRIEALAKNAKVSPRAGAVADSVSDNPSWFKGYRKDAVTAVGR